MHVKNSTLGEMHIYYDANRPDMVLYDGATYRYVHSLQGDILGLQNGAGNLVVEYRYDAWGRQVGKTGSLANSLGTLNPFRYRGYVYDEETGLYYLRSRYYSPWWGRFMSSDVWLGKTGSILQHNVFSYCQNNVVNAVDMDGRKTYLLNGIFNPYMDRVQDEVLHFAHLLEEEGVSNVVPIPTYTKDYFEICYIMDPIEWLREALGHDIYTSNVVEFIEADLATNPPAHGESINIIAYSGSGVIANNVVLQLEGKVNFSSVVLIGTPIWSWDAQTRAYSLISEQDPLTQFGQRNTFPIYVGSLSHTEYFNREVARGISRLLDLR